MSDFTLSQYEELMKPFSDLISDIVHIIGYENKQQEKEIAGDLLNQIVMSTIVMHISQQEKGKKIPPVDEIKEVLKNKGHKDVINIFTDGLTQENLTKYLGDSAEIVMTNYYFQVKDKVTEEKSEEINNLYQEIQGRV